jgi:hypothetical protein
MLYCDTRLGEEAWVQGNPEEALVRVPDGMKNCVCFLCVKKHDGSYRYGGTAFFVSVPSGADANNSINYIVTAKHCVKQAENEGGLFYRLNKYRQGVMFEKITTEWIFSEDEGVDVAITRFQANPDTAILHYALDSKASFASDEKLKEFHIGIGDNLFIVGLFTLRHGSTRNLPILRCGTIASMPDEPLIDENSGLPYRAYLAEVRSIGGLSGSPVFVTVKIGEHKPRYEYDPDRSMFPYTYFLLGVVRGHWDYGADQAAVDFTGSELRQVNMGIAMVTPVQEIMALLNREDVVRERRNWENQERKKRAPTLD